MREQTAGVRKRFFDGSTAVSLRCQRNGGKYKRKTIPQSFAQGSCSLRILLSPHPSFCNKLQKSTCTLAVPKIFCGIHLEYFDRGAKPCSLFRPLGALRKLCSRGRLTFRNGQDLSLLWWCGFIKANTVATLCGCPIRRNPYGYWKSLRESFLHFLKARCIKLVDF